MDKVYIETDRLLLRGWRDSDREPFAAMNADAEVMRHFPACMSREQSDALVDRIVSEIDEHGLGLFAVGLKDTGEFIGFVGLHRFSFDVPFAPGWEIGWRLDKRFWHHGYATEAAAACIDHARRHAVSDRLYSFTAVSNTPSESVMKRIGMTFSGRFMHPALPDGHPLKEHVLYALDLK